MPSFSDFVFEDFPDYDVTPEELMDEEAGDLSYVDLETFVDRELADEQPDLPGAGDSYEGTDPTAFSEQDGTIDEQLSSAPDAVTLGQADDPEAQEAVGDEAEGDDEDDTSDPALVDSERTIDATDEVRYPEQGQDEDELTYRSPESIQPSDEESVLVNDPELADIAQELLDWQDDENERTSNELFDWFIEQQDQVILSGDSGYIDDASINLEYLLDIDDKIRSELSDYEFESMSMDFELDGEDHDDLGDLFTSPSMLLDFADIVGGVDQDTYMTEFQYLNADDV